VHRIIVWLALLSGFVVAVAVAFALYSHFLMDYSLENLEFALSATQRSGETENAVGTKIYQRLVQDLALDEVAKEDGDLKSLAVLEMAARSFDESLTRAGNQRAEMYLTQAVKAKQDQRSLLLKCLDFIFGKVDIAYQQILQFIRYIHSKFLTSEKSVVEVSSYLLISQAEEKEKKWQLEEASKLYQKFLEFYPKHPDHGFVTLAYSHVLMKEKKYREAERILRGLAVASSGAEEFQIAAVLLKKINIYKAKDVQIAKLEARVSELEGTPEADSLKFKLGLQYIHSYSLDKAQAVFREIEETKDKNIRLKTKFYLGWIYKMQSDFDQGAEVMLELLEDDDLDIDFDLGSKAQLADIYYQNDDKKKALKYYEQIANASSRENDASKEIWGALADVEQAMIYYFDYGDKKKAEELMNSAEKFNLAGEKMNFDELREALGEASLDPRDIAFKYLFSGKVYEALDLFKQTISKNPDDAWAHSGLATTYLLAKDFFLAEKYAKRAYKIFPDTYTSAVYGHALSYSSQMEKASHLYENSIAMTGDDNYIPAQYNLAGLMLVSGQYEEANQILKPLEQITRSTTTALRPRILNNLAYSYWYLGDKELAIDIFNQALEKNPDFFDAKENLALIFNKQ
jgi:tetratricopeptide (TPR) repeat protein